MYSIHNRTRSRNRIQNQNPGPKMGAARPTRSRRLLRNQDRTKERVEMVKRNHLQGEELVNLPKDSVRSKVQLGSGLGTL